METLTYVWMHSGSFVIMFTIELEADEVFVTYRGHTIWLLGDIIKTILFQLSFEMRGGQQYLS